MDVTRCVSVGSLCSVLSISCSETIGAGFRNRVGHIADGVSFRGGGGVSYVVSWTLRSRKKKKKRDARRNVFLVCLLYASTTAFHCVVSSSSVSGLMGPSPLPF